MRVAGTEPVTKRLVRRWEQVAAQEDPLDLVIYADEACRILAGEQ